MISKGIDSFLAPVKMAQHLYNDRGPITAVRFIKEERAIEIPNHRTGARRLTCFGGVGGAFVRGFRERERKESE
jgi:hypothetical protein